MKHYTGKVAMVTGGGSGIGKSLSEALAKAGTTVVVADIGVEGAEAVVEEIRSAGGKAEALSLDVRDPEAVDAAVAKAFESHGRLDLMFNNAGIGLGGEVRHMDLKDWHDIVDVNLMGVVHGIQSAYPRMVDQGFGHLVNTSSLSGIIPAPGLTAYATTKHAVVGLSLSLRSEAAGHGVRVSVVCPGFVRTPILKSPRVSGMEPADGEKLLKKMWPFPLMEPDDLAREVLAGVAKNEPVIVAPRPARMLWRTFRWFPRRALGQLERLGGKEVRRRK